MSNTTSRLFLSAAPLAFIGALVFTSSALAAAEGIETVVVTAQKTEQNAQRVPIALTAFTAEDLAKKNISNVAQLSDSAPNVTFDAGVPFGGSTDVLSAYIRGIGQNDFAFNQDPGVGVYVDGVYLARSVGANQDLLDVERIEVLKGPQGTLFGRNTIGGAVSIVTRDPGDTFSYKADVTGGSYNKLDIGGTVDIPLADNLHSSFSFSDRYQDGYLKRIPFPTSGPLFDQAATASGLYMSPAQSAAAFGPGSPAGDCYLATSCPTIVDSTRAGIQAGYTTHDREGGESDWHTRGKLVWNTNDDLKFTLAADYSHSDGEGIATRPIAINPNYLPPGANPTLGNAYNTCIGSPEAFLTFLSTIPGVPNFPALCGPRGTPGSTYAPTGAAFANQVPGTLGGANFDGNPNNNRLAYGPWFVTNNIDTSYSTGPSFSKMTNYGAALTIDWNVLDNAHLKSTTAYRGLQWTSGEDGDGSPLNIHELSFYENQHEFSQELQLTGSTFDNALDYVVGLYYFNEGGGIHDYVTFPGLLLQVDGPNFLNTTSYAAYFHGDYHVTDKLTLTFGGRYTQEHKTFIGEQSDPNALVYKITPNSVCVPAGVPGSAAAPACSGATPNQLFLNCYNNTGVGDPITNACRIAMGFPDPNNPLTFYPPGQHTLDFSNFAPSGGVEYQFTDDMMGFVKYSEGFKTGSWTTRLSSPHPTYDPSLHFNPEKAKSYEAGLKTQFDDDRMRLNLTGFYTKYDGIQLNFQIGISPTILNAGNASIYGGELEYDVLLSDDLTVNSSIGYEHAAYDSVTPGAGSNGILITTHTPLPKTPEWKLNISPEYRLAVGNDTTLRFNVDYTYTSSMTNDVTGTPELNRPDTNMLNATVTYLPPNANWELSVGGTNLTDDRYVVTGVNQGGIQVIYGSYNAPREWMATLRIHS